MLLRVFEILDLIINFCAEFWFFKWFGLIDDVGTPAIWVFWMVFNSLFIFVNFMVKFDVINTQHHLQKLQVLIKTLLRDFNITCS